MNFLLKFNDIHGDKFDYSNNLLKTNIKEMSKI